jgi:DNA-binding NarL/FixJ family response regulator
MVTLRNPIRVLCVDDHDFVIEGLRARLTLEPDIECVGQAPCADNLISDVKRTNAQIVLLDIDMPGADPFEAIDALRRQSDTARVVILSAFIRDHYVDLAFDKGAWGYFSKADSTETVISGIRKVARGESAFSPAVLERVNAAKSANGNGKGSRLQALTPREREVLRLVGKGMARADIARTLHRSLKTIDAHHTSIMKKLDIHDRAELALYAVHEGLA